MSDQYLFGPIKFSELKALGEDVAPHVFGVDVDVFDPLPIEKLKAIGFVAKLVDGQFDFDLMDTMIQYHQLHCVIFLEVPFDFEMLAKDILTLANSINANVIIQPPKSGKPEDWATWSNYTKDFLSALLELPAFAQEVLPVTSYIEYMTMRVMGHTPQSLTDNPMMFEYFEKSMDVPTLDALKEDLYARLISFYGGESGFEIMVHTTLAAVHDNLKAMGEKALTRIQEALENGHKDAIVEALVEMLKRNAFPEERKAILIANEAVADPSGVLAGMEAQLLDIYQSGDSEEVAALAEVVSGLRKLAFYSKS